MLDQLLAIKKPELVIVVHDLVPGPSPFSRPYPGRVAAAVEDQSALWGVARRVKALLIARGDRVALITGTKLFKHDKAEGVDRCYVMVSGHNFSFGDRLGRDFFDPDGRSVRTKFGPIHGPVVEAMIADFQASLR